MASFSIDFPAKDRFCRRECRFDTQDLMIDTGDQAGIGGLYFLFFANFVTLFSQAIIYYSAERLDAVAIKTGKKRCFFFARIVE